MHFIASKNNLLSHIRFVIKLNFVQLARLIYNTKNTAESKFICKYDFTQFCFNKLDIITKVLEQLKLKLYFRE